MAIKKLQNDFTTPEQSKRLLELGVPADSANCFYIGKSMYIGKPAVTQEQCYFELLPCWSVGRLIEIITICREEIYTRLLFSRVDDHTNVENLIHYISAEIVNGHIDFSKLEE